MNEGVICMLDALGTKGIWNRENADRYLTSLQTIHDDLAKLKKYSDEKQMPHLEFDYLTVSDTIIMTWILKPEAIMDDPYCIIPIFARMIDGQFTNCFAGKLFMRGAISYGKFIKSGSILVGPAVDDAAMFHDLPNMIGVVLTPNTTLLADDGLEYLVKHPIDEYDHSQHLIKYRTPMKGGSEMELYQINWPLSLTKAWENLPKGPSVTSRLKTWLGENPIPPEAYIKYENTLKFYEFCNRNSSES